MSEDGLTASMMRESCVLALSSRRHCRAGPGDKPDCGWYHGFWRVARALGLGKFAGGHADFLVATMGHHAREGGYSRVLVSGTVDFSMPALVYQAYESEAQRVELTVVDWCETPLELTRWYAERTGREVRTLRANVLDLRSAGQFDLILTNSFLGYFEPSQRPLLFSVWARLLRIGGKAVFTNRVRPEFGEGLVGFGAKESERFCREVDERAVAGGAMLGLDPEAVKAGARDYVRRFGVYPVASHEEIRVTLQAAGFGEVQSDLAESGAARLSVSGPSTVEQSTYARIVATRT